MMKSKVNALYIHIPFCRNICSYCDFAKVILNQKRLEGYLKSLFFEFQSLKKTKYRSIYIGGGTPSSLPLPQLEALLKLVSPYLKKQYEFTIECNVEDLSEDFLKLLSQYKVNRLSVGVQTFHPTYIQLMNRHHTKEMVFQNIALAKHYITNISIDMMFALPNQNMKQLQEDIALAMALPITHISYYSLLIEEGTVFKVKGYENMEDALQAKMYHHIHQELKKNGLNRYEISSFAKKGYQSKHNLVYWHNESYYGIGLNASGYINSLRYTNNRNLNTYSEFDFTHKEEIYLSKEDQEFEEIMLRLRLDEGINIAKFNQLYNIDFLSKYDKAIKTLLNQKLIKVLPNKIKTTMKGSLLLNDVLQLFMQ